jgi:hypothetical protein
MSSSKRQLILDDVVLKLKSIKSPRLGKVSQKPEEFSRLARTAFPFILVTVVSETKEDIAMDSRLSTLNVDIKVTLDGKGKTENGESQMTAIIEAIEEKLEADRSRDGNAQLTELLEVGDVSATAHPLISQTLSFGIQYTYLKGNT